MQNYNSKYTNNDSLKLALKWLSIIQEDAQEYYNKLLVTISEILERYKMNNFVDALYRGKIIKLMVCEVTKK